jgi:hypothetical protein
MGQLTRRNPHSAATHLAARQTHALTCPKLGNSGPEVSQKGQLGPRAQAAPTAASTAASTRSSASTRKWPSTGSSMLVAPGKAQPSGMCVSTVP